MTEKSKNEKPASFKVYQEDYTVLTDDEGHPILGEDGKEISALDIWCYCEKFTDQAQAHLNSEYENLPREYDYFYQNILQRYNNGVTRDNQFSLMKRAIEFVKDSEIIKFQEWMEQQHAHVNAFALYNLCCFINYIIHEQKVVLLKPRVGDTLSEINKLKSITFHNQDGSTAKSDNSYLLKIVLDAIKEKAGQDAHSFEVHSVEERTEVYTRELMEAEFVFNLANFMHDNFKINRRNNGLLSKNEQNIVSYFLSWFKLSPTKVSASRFRQLKQLFPLAIWRPSMGFMDILKYNDWKNGKYNLLKGMPQQIEPGDTIYFPKDLNLKIKESKDLI